MNRKNQPLVTVLTPVYNMGEFLEDCIQSVLNQTYQNFEYIIVNNCSTDRTLEVAMKYAAMDSRVRVITNDRFVPVIENHNIAFRQVSAAAKYCKVVCADDLIFPECLERMIGTAEANPTAGFVGCYQVSGERVLWQGFSYPRTLFPAREICRKIWLEDNPAFGFGCTNSLLYRADLVRSGPDFFPNPSPHADTSACFKHLKDWDFAFVHQVLCCERTHEQTQTHKSKEINRYSSAILNDLIEYGHYYLTDEEFAAKLKQYQNSYFEFLATSLIESRGKEFWNYHTIRLKELGCPITTAKLFRAGMRNLGRNLLNPALTLNKIRRRFAGRRAAVVEPVPKDHPPHDRPADFRPGPHEGTSTHITSASLQSNPTQAINQLFNDTTNPKK